MNQEERIASQSKRLAMIKKCLEASGNVKEWVLWSSILVFIENKGTASQKDSLHSILSGKNHPGTITIRSFVYQFLSLTKEKISNKTDENLLFNLFCSIDGALLEHSNNSSKNVNSSTI